MKNALLRLATSVSFATSIVALLAATFSANRANAADRTWNGGGSDNNWSTPANWGGTAPVAGDALFFGGSVRTSPFNDFPAGTLFTGITINNGAGLFALRGNAITLGGDLADNMALVPQTNLLTLSLNATRRVNVVADGLLTLGGTISGAGAGLTKTGDGLLTLTSPNTFSGPVQITGGTLSVASDANLGAAPGAVDPGRIVIQWPGALRTTATFTLNPNRGITVGSAGLSGRLTVNSGTTLTYNGRISDNGQGAGLTKNGFGGLTLSGANTYTGGTEIQNGTVTLDFGQASAPANNIISSSSALRLGGANAGLGAASFDALIMNGGGAANSQTFNGTTIDIGPAIIRANSGGGPATMNLGGLTHAAGGILNLITPTATGGAGSIHTTTANLNGILGGWATVGNGGAFNNITMGTEWASVDGSGNIVPYTAYRVYQTAENLHSIATAGTNLRINGTSTGDVVVDSPEAGTITDVNTINLSETRAFSIVVGNNNTLRLGSFGSIFKSDNANNITWALGSGTTGGANGTQDQGTLTAGGAPDTPGEIVFYMNNGSSQSQGSLNVEAKVTDNGSGPVTLVKAGPASMKLRGHNTFSGGLILLQGRLQFAGSEIGTGNPDGGGTGLIYVYPGAYIFPSGAGDFGATGVAISNNFFVAGLGTQQEQVGAIRFGNGTRIAGDVTLIGDSRLGGGNATTLPNTGISGKISGPFNLDIGALGTINTFISLFNPANDWTGATTFNARNTATANSVRNGASEVIPNGVGRGNVTLNGNTSTGTITWDLNGFNETINGLLSAGNLAGCIIVNNLTATTSTLTVGDYDQTATFGGTIQNGASGAGVMALTKIGGGRQTLTGANTYTGTTTVNGGTLAVGGSGSIATSQHIVANGGTLDVSEVAGGFTHAFPVDVTNGALVVRSTAFPGIASLSLTDSRVRVTSLGATPIAVETSGLSTGGQTNLIDIASVGAIAGYPVQFTIVKYAGAIGGAGFNFGLGAVPTASTVGFISNNVDNSSVDVVLLDGPKTLTWTGTAGPAWDINSTVNWLAFGATPSVFLDVDSVRFDDSASTVTVNLTTALQPGSVLVNNTALDFTFTGAGKITGPSGLTKEGVGTLILDNTGTNDFFGPLTINGGTVQVGNSDANGSLSAGNVINNAGLVFARTDAVTVGNVISGAGTLTQNGPGILTLGGESVFTGPAVVAQGTLRPGSPSAFGSVDGATTVSSGATLDVNGQSLGAEPINVSGSGVGGNGAIVNSGSEQLSALRSVTLLGDTTLGGTSRWDIRNTGGAAALSSGGAAYNLTKNGANQVSLVGVTVDAALGDITIKQGLLGFETSTTSMGDPARTLTVEPGATLSFFNSTALWDKHFMLQGNSVNASVTNWSGSNTIVGPVTLNGDCVFGVAGTALRCNGTISGSGNLVKQGAGPLTLAGLGDYSGLTIVSNGTLTVDGSLQSGGDVQVYRGTLAGAGVVGPSVTIGANGNLAPGNPASPFAVLQLGNNLVLAGTCTIDLNKAASPLIHDVVVFVTDLTFGGTLRLNISGPPLVAGDEFVFFNYVTATGGFSRIEPSSPGPGLAWDASRLAIDGALRVVALPTPGIATISIMDNNVVLSGTNGVPGTSSYVLSTTNVALPLASWVRIATNVFDANGNFNFTNVVNPNTPQQFFSLQLP
jgi:autotransporter-associated beta strand protein